MESEPRNNSKNTETPLEYCRRITRDRAKNFYWAIITLPGDKRDAVYTIYAFARRCDDIADSEKGVNEKKERLANQRTKVQQMYAGEVDEKLYVALKNTAEKYEIPKRYFDQLITGVEMDLDRSEYETFADMKVYCYRVASIVGLILIEIFEYDDEEAKKYAVDLGIGMQLTNIIRDVSEDYERGRIYLPLEDLERFDCDLSKMDDGPPPKEFKKLLSFEAERAKKYFESGKKLFPYLSRRTRVCPAGLYGVYYNLLTEMENSDWDVWRERASLPTVRKLGAVFGQWFATIRS